MTTKLIAADASAGAILDPSAGDGTLVIQTGLAGAKVDAISIAADGTPLFLKGRLVAQTVSSLIGSTVSGTTVIPLDDTVPQNTEGTQVLTASITPRSATSVLEVNVILQLGNAGAAWLIGALFRDAGVNAIAVGTGYASTGNAVYTVSFSYFLLAGSTAPTTFNVRMGSEAGTYYLNGNNAGRKFGGAYASSIIIKEYLP